MGILCKIFGHKHQTERNLPRIKRSGWELEYNAAYQFIEFNSFCERCCTHIPIGIYSEPKEKDNESST